MRKFIVLLGFLLFVTGCGVSEEKKTENEEGRFNKDDFYLSITVDNETSCKYIIYHYSHAGGITPLLKSDGTPDCE